MMKKLVFLIPVLVLAASVSVRADAKATYEEQCAKCHGTTGKGDTKMGEKAGAKNYTDAKVQEAMKDDKAFKSIKEGMKEGDKVLMKPFDKLSDVDIKALIAYMRTFKK
jgi:mono/diheme cytochrome c family protein